MVLRFEGREINGSTHARFYSRLQAVAQREGWRLVEIPKLITHDEWPGRQALGATNFHTNHIEVCTIIPDNMKVRVLAHELGHALVGRPDKVWPRRRHDEVLVRSEVVADSVAMRVCHGIGLDVRDVVTHYLVGLNQDTVRLSLDRDWALVHKTADRILQEITSSN